MDLHQQLQALILKRAQITSEIESAADQQEEFRKLGETVYEIYCLRKKIAQEYKNIFDE